MHDAHLFLHRSTANGKMLMLKFFHSFLLPNYFLASKVVLILEPTWMFKLIPTNIFYFRLIYMLEETAQKYFLLPYAEISKYNFTLAEHMKVQEPICCYWNTRQRIPKFLLFCVQRECECGKFCLFSKQ